MIERMSRVAALRVFFACLMLSSALGGQGCIAMFRQDTPGSPPLLAASAPPQPVKLYVQVKSGESILETGGWPDAVSRLYDRSGSFVVETGPRRTDTWLAEVEIFVEAEEYTTPLLSFATALLVPSRQRATITMVTSLVPPRGEQAPVIREEATLDTWLGWVFLPVSLVTLRSSDAYSSEIIDDLVGRTLSRIQQRGELRGGDPAESAPRYGRE